jgi:hypothetical protein
LAIITPAQFREHYPQLTGTGEDTILATLVTRADALCAQYCGFPRPDAGVHTFEDVTYTLYPPGPDRDEPRRISLRIYPIVSVTSAYVDETEGYAAGTAVASGDMVLDKNKGQIWLTPSASSAWAYGGRSNKITIVAGFTAAPDDLVAIIAAQVRHLLDQRRVQGVTQASAASQYVARPDANLMIPKTVQDMLSAYVIWENRVQ